MQISNLYALADMENQDFQALYQEQKVELMRLRKVFHQTNEAIFIYDLETHLIQEVNETACRWLGYTEGELKQMNWNEIELDFPFQTPAQWNELIKEIRHNNPQAYTAIAKYATKTGAELPVEVSWRYEEFEGKASLVAVARDISSHLKFEEIIEYQNKRFQSLIENLDDAILLTDDIGKIIYASPSAYKQWGYNDGDLEGCSIFELIHKEEAPFFKKIFVEVISTRRKLFKTTFKLLYKNHAHYWVEAKVKNLLREPAIKAIVFNIHNVTNQTLAEEKIINALENEKNLNEKLAQREDRLRKTLELVQETESKLKSINQDLENAQNFAKMGIWSMNLKTEKIKWSKQVFSSFGMDINTEKEPPNRKELIQLLHPEDRKEFLDLIRKTTLDTTKPYELELRQLQKNTHEYRWFLTKAIVLSTDPQVGMVLSGINVDIHDRKLVEEKVKDNEFKLETVSNKLSGITIYQIIFDRARKYVSYCSENAEKMYGISVQKLSESMSSFYKFVHPEDVEGMLKAEKEAYQNRTFFDYEIRYFRGGDSKNMIWLYFRASVSYLPNGEAIFNGISIDITERKKAEEELLKANEDLKKANTELDRFVYSASHDLRAPIASVLGLISLCKLTNNVDEIKSYLSLQEKSVIKLDNFIHDILDYSRNARLEMVSEKIQFQELLDSVFEQHSYMDKSKHIAKIINLKEKEDFFSDKSRLLIICNNIISNSIRYSNLKREEPCIEVNINIEKQFAFIEFVDNGVGIAREHISKVFEMFYRANDSQTGSGLGLYIVKETVQKLKGNIKIDSELGNGTKILIQIPNLKSEN
jgi:PAS domain S-box-containing protein